MTDREKIKDSITDSVGARLWGNFHKDIWHKVRANAQYPVQSSFYRSVRVVILGNVIADRMKRSMKNKEL